jgi:hypothetical protein
MRLLRVLTGQLLPCGCLVGIYETYEGRVVASIDARGYDCDHHRLHQTLSNRRAGAAARDGALAPPPRG